MNEINFFGEAVNVDLQCPVLASQLLHLLNLRKEVGQEVKWELVQSKEVMVLVPLADLVDHWFTRPGLENDHNFLTV